MAGDISEVTGQEFYSGGWQDIRDICRALNIGDGKISKVTQNLVNRYQEMVDREIDGQLSSLYYTPLQPYNQVMADGNEKSVFPGEVRRLARYWTAGLLLQSEFQGNEPNVQEAATTYIDDSKRMLYNLKRFNQRITGQEYRSTMRTMPPTFQPPIPPEANF